LPASPRLTRVSGTGAARRAMNSSGSRITVFVLAILTITLSSCVHAQRGVETARAENRSADNDYGVSSLEFYVLANTQFVLFHELGHALMHTLKLPVLGREEDAADTLAIAGLLIGDIEQLQQKLLERLIVISDEWLLEWDENENQSTYWDTHSFEIQRFYNIVCLIYGSDPQRFGDIALSSALPVERSFGCQHEFKVARHAVDWVLTQHGRLGNLRTPREQRANEMVKVSYETPITPNGKSLATVLAKDGLVDRMAADVDAAFALPEKIEIQVANCTEPDAYFHTESRIVVLCWELLEDFLERGKRRAAAGPQSLCAAPVAAKLRPTRLGCPMWEDH
jgi:hypothetical protein